MVNMAKFFKREEKRPFTYPSIEERRTNSNYLGWIVGIVLITAIGIIIFLIF